MMKMKDYNNIKYLFYNESKKINTIILPGFLQTNHSYQNLFDTIRKYSNIYVIEFPGFGISEKLDYVVSLDYYVILLRNFIQDLKLDNVILLGHSFGGRVITKYESIYNDSAALILIDSAGIKQKSLKKSFKVLKYKLKKKLFKLLKLKKLYSKLVNTSGSKDYQKLDSVSKQTFNNIIKENTIKYLTRIDTLTFIIWGELDKETPLKMGEIMNRKIKNSTLIKIKDVGHFPHLEKPLLINNIINCFYQEVILSVIQ